jgi:hypothetical protein
MWFVGLNGLLVVLRSWEFTDKLYFLFLLSESFFLNSLRIPLSSLLIVWVSTLSTQHLWHLRIFLWWRHTFQEFRLKIVIKSSLDVSDILNTINIKQSKMKTFFSIDNEISLKHSTFMWYYELMQAQEFLLYENIECIEEFVQSNH